MNTLKRVFAIFTLNLIISIPLQAASVEQRILNFPIKTEQLLKGESHFFFTILSPRKMAVQYPELIDLDSLSLAKDEGVAFIVTKSVMAVNKPVGFFDENQIANEKYLSQTLDAKVVGTNEEGFNVHTRDFSYKLKMYFDADDVSTSPKHVIKAVSAAKKLDIISQSASSIIFMEKTNFSRGPRGGVSISSYQPIKENKTLVITYQLWALTKKQKLPDLKENFIHELEETKSLIESFKP